MSKGASSVGEKFQIANVSRVDFLPSLGVNCFFAVFDAFKIYPVG
jgi:hypothetical protein